MSTTMHATVTSNVVVRSRKETQSIVTTTPDERTFATINENVTKSSTEIYENDISNRRKLSAKLFEYFQWNNESTIWTNEMMMIAVSVVVFGSFGIYLHRKFK